MTTNAQIIDIDFSHFQDIDNDEAQIVDGGWVHIAIGVAAGAAGVVAVAGAFGAGVAIGYYVNKDESPDEPIMVPGT